MFRVSYWEILKSRLKVSIRRQEEQFDQREKDILVKPVR